MPKMYDRVSVMAGAAPPLPHQVSITAGTASGKTTLINGLKRELGQPPFTFMSAGGFLRGLAIERGFTLPNGHADMVAFTDWQKKNPGIDFDALCDERTRQFIDTDFIVFEGRRPNIFLLRAYKVALICNAGIRAERRARQENISQSKALSDIERRDHNDRERYEAKYPGSEWPLHDFDLVVDNSAIGPDEVLRRVIDGHAAWVKKIRPEAVDPQFRTMPARA